MRTRWRFLPRTAILYNGSYTRITYAKNVTQYDGDVVRSSIGLNGLVTSRLSLLGMVGWAGTFYDQGRTATPQQFNSLTAQAEVKWFIAGGGQDVMAAAPVGLSYATLGYTRDVSNSYLGNFYQRDRGYAGFSYMLGGVFVSSLDVGISNLSFPESFFADGVQQHKAFSEQRFDARLFGEYRASSIVGINATVSYDQNITKVSIPTDEGNLALKSRETLEALKFVKALFQETETPEVFAWDASSNNRQMLAGRSSLVLNAISITRAGENDKMPIHEKIALAKPPKGPVRQIGLEHVMDCYLIWKFSENIDDAKTFLVDYIDNFKQGFMASEFYNFPCFSKTVPDLTQLIAKDSKAVPPDKYAVLSDVLDWATNVGYPGNSNAAIDETFNTWVINTMFAEAAAGAETPENALARAEAKMKAIWAKWKDRKMI